MSKKKRNELFYLEDMYESMLRIQDYIEGLSYSEFKKNNLVIDAVIRNLEVIGEASKNVPASVKQIIRSYPGNRCMGYGILLSTNTSE